MTKSPSGPFRLCVALLLISQTVWPPSLAMANPEGGTVVAGQATIAAAGNALNVTAQTDRAVVNWNSFSIGAGEVTNFNLPSANSAILNRVTGGNPSTILGQLNSNGNVFLINPSGVLIGPSGVIATNGFTASTFDIGNQEFMRGGDLTFQGESKASIINQGVINTGTGGAALIGHQVINSGTITSNGGNITLATGGSVTLSDGSRVIQADIKTIATGISETAPLIKSSGGTIRATGAVKTGGEVYLVGPGSKVVRDTLIAASKVNTQGQTTGGKVVITGDTVELANAQIDASGQSGGGQVNIGGGLQGKDPTIANAKNTTVAAATKITANATESGNGGQVILWADGTMDFRGVIENRGTDGYAGGFTEVSGLEFLEFHGSVDTGGGELLLDPFNYTIGATQAANIVAALGNNSVTIQTTAGNSSFGSAAGAGDIIVNADLEWDSVNSLTLLAQGFVRFNANVINHNTSGGDLNIVAGWNGRTPFDAAAFLAEDVRTTTVFGRDTANVFVGAGGHDRSVQVGSRDGSTNVFAGDVFVRGGGEDRAHGRLGYRGRSGPAINGPINVRATNRLDVVSGVRGLLTFGQIGHSRFNDDSAAGTVFVDGPITVAVAGDIYIGRQIGLDGGRAAYAQIGHGGIEGETLFDAFRPVRGTHRGNIRILQADEIRLQGGNSASAYAQLGSISQSPGSNIIIDQAEDIFVLAGNGSRDRGDTAATAGIGNGNASLQGGRRGNVTISHAQDIHIHGGGGLDATAFLGHATLGDSRGEISINARSLEMIGGSGAGAGVQVGHGDISSLTNGFTNTINGDIDVRIAQEITLVDGTGEDSEWLIGHTTAGTRFSSRRGDITIVTNSLDYELDFHESITTINADFADRLHGGLGSIRGTLTVASTNTRAGPSGGMIVAGTFNGEFTGKSTAGASIANYNFLSAADLRVESNIKTDDAFGSKDVNLVAGWDGSSGLSSTFNSADFLAAEVGNTTLFGKRSGSVFIGQSSATHATQVGSRFGRTNVFAHDLIMTASGAVDEGHTILGFRATDQGNDFNITGPVNVLLSGKLRAIAGNKEGSFVQIGHVGSDFTKTAGTIEANVNAPLRIEATEQIFLRGGGRFSYAQVGHGGYFAEGDMFGDVDITTADGLIGLFGGGSNVDSLAYTRIGHGGFLSPGDRGGNITVSTDGDGFLHPGSTASHAHIGHGGGLSDGTLSGDVLLDVGGNLEVGNSDGRAYRQIGHGGPMTTGDFSGTIDVDVGGSLTVRGTRFASEYGLIGHGNEPGSRDSGVTAAGDVTVGVGSGARLVKAGVGHAVDAGGVYRSGKTFLAVGTSNYSSANTTDVLLVSDAALNSAAAGNDGELRIYLPRTSSVQFNGTSTLNGVDAATFGGSLPNLQGAAVPFTGDYDVNLAEGNFGFYIPPILLSVNANSGSSVYGGPHIDPGLSLAPGSGDLLVGDDFADIGLTTDFNLDQFSSVDTYTLQVMIGPEGLDSKYQLVDSNNGTYTINQAPLTISANRFAKTYGDDLQNLLAIPGRHFSVDASQLKNGETVTRVDLTSPGFAPTASVAGGPYVIVPSNPTGANGFNPDNYNVTEVNGFLSVNKAPLTITAKDFSKPYGTDLTGLLPVSGRHFEVDGSQLRNGETVTGLTLRSRGFDPTASVAGGPYEIVPSNPIGRNGFNPDNYDFQSNFVHGQLTVTKAPLVIRPKDQMKTYGDLFAFNGTEFTARGLKNRETIGSVTLQSAATPKTADAGLYRSGASNPVGGTFDINNYDPTFVTGVFDVKPARLAITPKPREKEYGDPLPVDDTQFVIRGELKNDDEILGVALRTAGRVPTASVGLYDITPTGITRSRSFKLGNYDIAFNTLVNGLTVNPAPLLIVPNDQFKPVRSEFVFDPTSDFTAITLKNGETIGAVTLVSPGSPAAAPLGLYPIIGANPTGGTFDINNYRVRFARGTMIVSPRFGEFTYDNFVRQQDQWRTLQSIFFGTGNGGGINYGQNEEEEEPDGNLTEQDSFDVFGAE